MTDDVTALIARMRADLTTLEAAGDARRFFHGTYLRTTETVAARIDDGGFADPDWLARWDVVFADFYVDALAADLAGRPVPSPWRAAFDAAREQPDLAPLRHVLFGMNAHINYDLPQALLAVITPEDFDDPAVLAGREDDHRRLDEILRSRVDAEDAELRAVSRTTLLDRLMRPANQAASRHFVAEARAKVWRNALVLDRARRAGTYDEVLADLEKRCTDHLVALSAPGPVLLRLARRGFGVLLPGA